jgi:putative SOS response-associated peptidase YedK
MCGRFIQVSNPDKIKVQISDLEISSNVISDFRPRYNIAPTQNILTVLNTEIPEMVFTRWGLIPFWAKDQSIGQRMINARGETLLEKSSFRKPFRRQRCIIFSDGFYEWRSSGKNRIPFLVRMKDEEPFGMAGLWDRWTDPATKTTLTTSTIITTNPNDLVTTIHNRMPAILEKHDYRTWLDPGEVGDDVLMGCIRSYPSAGMKAYEVSRLVNNPAYDSSDCVSPLW